LNYNDDIVLSSSNGNAVNSNNCSGSDMGIYLLLSSSHNELFQNQVWNNQGYGVYVLSGSSNRIWNNTIMGNNGATGTFNTSHVQAYDGGTLNSWNSTDGYGNWWSDWQSPDNAAPYGIVDHPYNISGSAGAKDNYPLTTPTVPIPEFGMMPLVLIAFLAMTVLAGEIRLKKP
jgi:parallel beta-helix repeat protein